MTTTPYDLHHETPPPVDETAVLQRANRLATLGLLCAGVVHDLGHFLNGISLANGLIRRWFDDLGPALAHLESADAEVAAALGRFRQRRDDLAGLLGGIEDNIERMAGMATDLKQYVKDTPGPEDEAVDLVKVARHAVAILHPLLERATSRLRLDLPDRPAWVGGIRLHLEQVVVNLLVNAAQALPDPDKAIAVVVCTEVDQVHLEVADEGIGMPPEIVARLGQGFYTTRSDGSGLGWTIIRRLVGRHGGVVAIESRPQAGTRVRISLPAGIGPG